MKKCSSMEIAVLTRRRETKFATIKPRFTSPNDNFEESYPLNNDIMLIVVI